MIDDTVYPRSGKKMPGISSHFDHTQGRHVMGQPVVTLDIACEDGFVPLDNKIFVSQVKAQPLTTLSGWAQCGSQEVSIQH